VPTIVCSLTTRHGPQTALAIAFRSPRLVSRISREERNPKTGDPEALLSSHYRRRRVARCHPRVQVRLLLFPLGFEDRLRSRNRDHFPSQRASCAVHIERAMPRSLLPHISLETFVLHAEPVHLLPTDRYPSGSAVKEASLLKMSSIAKLRFSSTPYGMVDRRAEIDDCRWRSVCGLVRSPPTAMRKVSEERAIAISSMKCCSRARRNQTQPGLATTHFSTSPSPNTSLYFAGVPLLLHCDTRMIPTS